MGLAINDSIVVLTDLKHSTALGTSAADSVIHSTRHVVATSTSTVAGVLPLVLAGGEFWPPMMIVIAGGVVGATFLALALTPSLYLLTSRNSAMDIDDWKKKHRVAPNEWVVLTGSTSGIGYEFLNRLCQAGCNVIAVSDEAEKLAEDKAYMESHYGVMIKCYCVDLSCFNAVIRLGQDLAGENVIGLINNAGFGVKGDFLSHPIARYGDLIAVNATAPVVLQHAILPQLQEKKRGSVSYTHLTLPTICSV